MMSSDPRKDEGIADMTGRSTLLELLDIMKGAALVVSNDTGPARGYRTGAKTVVIVEADTSVASSPTLTACAETRAFRL